ncbi:T9SS type A sorting domain-containing protein [Maribellus comscasis]|uniref:T9SS type A sorting domain-containing protein n=1 Tax=Maribellus comscasis TaxID=2681766 RepID=A0A6I6JVJ7_9BACT|nr:T9SS type A sorting domain-containing protein [Maribellus comscasis]QGY45128.1 T9SS type A sorting domain-containing protein [Maribellus comscasis]
MKKFYLLKEITLLLFFLLFTYSVFSQESLFITTPGIELAPGETISVSAGYTDSMGIEQEVKIKWNTEPGYLGKVDKNGLFTASHSGEGILIAKYKELRDSVNLKVTGTPKGTEEENTAYPKVKVTPGKIKVMAGDSVELAAFYINELDQKVDTIFSWSVWPAELGSFSYSSENMFYAHNVGKGILVASLGELADTVKLEVEEPKVKTNNGNNSRQMQILPGDTIVALGSLMQIQYDAVYKTNGNKHDDAEVVWILSGDSIGAIEASTGLLTLSGETGLALIKAEYSNFSASVELLVVDSLVDPVVNTITIHRVLPDGTELPAKLFNEGESYKIGGLPFPLNILNGGMIHFPFGCIDEDILIYMFIPDEYAEVDEDSVEVEFENEIITGVKFNVMPVGSDSIVEPYYFNIPLNLSLIYKHGLLDSLGVSPENLDVFFAENTGFTDDGTGSVAIDTVKNKIYAAIEHFSTIVVKQKENETFARDLGKNTGEMLMAYPNPFSVSTQLAFKLSKKSDIDLSIYNLFGQKVKVLVHEEKSEGLHTVEWNGMNENGTLSSPGIYFCRMLLNGDKAVVKQLILNNR